MADYVLTNLTKRCAELAAKTETLRARRAQIETDVGHLNAVIRHFDLDYDLASIRPKRPARRMQRGGLRWFILKGSAEGDRTGCNA